MNQFVFSGRLTADPQTKKVGEHTLTEFSIAVKRGYGKEVDFFDIQTWRVTAENCAKFLSKGSSVIVMGKVQKRSYENKEGKKVWVTDYIGDNVEFTSIAERKETVPAGDEEEYF